jgi:amino acid adenylation domain-containing protein
LVSAVRTRLAVEITVKDVFEQPTIRGLALQIGNYLRSESAQVLRPTVPKAERGKTGSGTGAHNEALPLSFAQQRLWLIDQLQGNSAHYNMPAMLAVEGRFSAELAKQALQRIIGRHEVLRTVYHADHTGAVQIIKTHTLNVLPVIDLSHLDDVAQQREIQRLAHVDAATPFDLSRDVMLRASWLQLEHDVDSESQLPASDHHIEQKGDEEGRLSRGVLLFNMHHIASDGWSVGVLIQEFVEQYQALLNGHPDPLEPLAIQYADYALWLRDYLQGEVQQKQLDHWLKHLDEAPVVHGLPLDFERPSIPQYEGALVSCNLPDDITAGLTAMAKAHTVTPFMLLHGAFSLLLARHSNRNDVIIGTPMANRLQQELTPLIGFFVNTLVLRTNTDGCETFLDYLAHIKTINLDAQAYQDIPFEHLVEQLQVHRSTSHTPLFQIMLTMDNNAQQALALDGITFSPMDGEVVSNKFDLELDISMCEHEGIHLAWTYDKALFKPETVQRLNRHLVTLLQGIVSQPDIPLQQLAMLSDDEQQLLIEQFNGFTAPAKPAQLVHRLFEAQVEVTPDNIAVEFVPSSGDIITLSYQALNQAANRLAHYLRGHGVSADTLVGICVERSADMVIAVLAVLKAGGAYVPLDPNYPQSRVDYILQDTGLQHLLSWRALTQKFSFDSGSFSAAGCNGTRLDLDCAGSTLAAYPEHNPAPLAQQGPANLMYIIYTSGSTGLPKGVMLSHHNLNHYLRHALQVYGQRSNTSVVNSTLSFDATVTSLYVPLLQGGRCIVLAEDKAHLQHLASQIEQARSPLLLKLTPAHLQGLAALLVDFSSDLPHVLVLGGEQLGSELLWQWQQQILPQSLFVNEYGPTEASVGCTTAIYGKNHRPVERDQAVSIGRGIVNTGLYILSVDGQLTPPGAIGELYIGGEGLARGYLNRDDLTAERFINNPFAQGRLYRTGDLVRYGADNKGDLTFIGRMDDQLKIRGYRIEPGEIEHQLLACEQVESSLVMAQKDHSGLQRLVAYVLTEVTGEEHQSELINQLKTRLQQSLPDYMVPCAFMLLDEWPLTDNGKINKKALPEPDVLASQSNYTPPETQTEQQLVTLWSETLQVDTEQLSTTVNFLDLGGHSLSAVRLLNAIDREMTIKLSVEQLFNHNTIHALARIIDRARAIRATETSIKALSHGEIERMEF